MDFDAIPTIPDSEGPALHENLKKPPKLKLTHIKSKKRIFQNEKHSSVDARPYTAPKPSTPIRPKSSGRDSVGSISGLSSSMKKIKVLKSKKPEDNDQKYNDLLRKT